MDILCFFLLKKIGQFFLLINILCTLTLTGNIYIIYIYYNYVKIDMSKWVSCFDDLYEYFIVEGEKSLKILCHFFKRLSKIILIVIP